MPASQAGVTNGFRFSDEAVTAFELGGKVALLDGAAQLNFVDEHFLATDPDPNVVQDDYWKIDARLAVSNAADTWELAVVGRNLTDEITASLGNEGNGSAANSYFKMIESPRAIALQATYRF